MSKRSGTRARSVVSVMAAGIVSFTVVGAGIAYASSGQEAAPTETVIELSIGTVPTIRSADEISMPIDGYWVPAEQQNLVLRAEREAMASCMARFGLEWDVPVQEVEAEGFPYDGLFGVVNLEEVKRYGYGVPGGDGGTVSADGSITDPVKQANSVTITDEQAAVASGSTELAAVNGSKIPAGGCIAEARSQVGTQNDPVLALTEATIGYGAMQADKDPRVLEGFAQWSECMAASGYSYATPWEANDDPRWSITSEATEEEIAVAVTDVECQQKINLAGLRVAVAAAWQQEYIQARKEDFATVRTIIADQRAAALSVLAARD